MTVQRLLGLMMLCLILNVASAAAQEPVPSLRELAERNNFYVGAAVYTYHLDDPTHSEILSREFNVLTPEHEAKHCQIELQPGRYDFRNFDRLVAYAEENDMAVHGHALVWHSCMPAWLEDADYSREEAIQLLRDYIMTTVGRYKGRIPVWDVVNEAVAEDGEGLRDTPWRRMIGDDYVELAFQFAHEADPDALLFYNDYGAEGMNTKSDTVYGMVQDMLQRGVPVHGVGLQSHFTIGGMNVASIADNIQRLGELGLEVQITEIDIRFSGDSTEDILQMQAGDYYQVFETCLESEYCSAFIIWGVSDQYTWLRGSNLGFFNNPEVDPLLFDDDYEPKPAYYALLDALARRAGEPPVLSDDERSAMLGIPDSTIDIPEPSKSDPEQLAPDSIDGAVYYAAFPVAIELDGEVADWENVPRVTVDSGPMLPEDHDTAMTFAAAADDTYLYFLAEVTDSELVYGVNEPQSGWYEEDSVEFYINATGDLELSSYQPGVVQLGILAANITGSEAPILGGGNSEDSQVQVAVVETEDGYIVEAAVPLVTEVWTIEPQHLGVLGFQAHLNSASAANRDTKLIWSRYDTQDQSWTNPSVFGQLIFWDINQ